MLFNQDLLESYPLDAGVYLMKNRQGAVIYIGKASCLKKRLKQYFAIGRDTRATIPLLLKELSSIDTIIVPTEKEALLLENTLIKKHQPKFNILLKDDKTYISLSINTKEKWPKLRWNRFKQKPKDGALHFGPYTSAKAAKETFELITHLFPLRQCSDEELKRRTRPCMLYDIKRCLAPCMHKCDEAEYNIHVKGTIDFLEGNSEGLCKSLEKEMLQASEALEFEKAAAILKALRQVEHVTKTPALTLSKSVQDSTDVLGFYREGDKVLLVRMLFRNGTLSGSKNFFFENTLEDDNELLSSFLLQEYVEEASPKEIFLPFPLPSKDTILSILQDRHGKKPTCSFPQKGEKKELLDLANKNAKAAFEQKATEKNSLEDLLYKLQETLHLTRYPKKIECFDTSSLSGTNLVAAMCVFIEGKEDPKKRRLYHVKDIHASDDCAAIRQVLTRRLLTAKAEEDFPDLLLIDGGKGQLNTALEVLKELDLIHIDVISLVKEKARHDKGLTKERAYIAEVKDAIAFPSHSPLLFFLQKIRDVVHSKAIAFHKKTRAKKTIGSALDNVPGIGPSKKKKLLSHFGSVQNILLSKDDLIEKNLGFTLKDVQNIKNQLQKE